MVDYTPRTLLSKPLSLPTNVKRLQLQFPVTKSISGLEFTTLSSNTLGDNELEVQVEAYSLNFRDIFAILKPIDFFDDINSAANDFSGIVSRVGGSISKFKVGDLVFGCHDQNLAIATHVTVSQNVTHYALYITSFMNLIISRFTLGCYSTSHPLNT